MNRRFNTGDGFMKPKDKEFQSIDQWVPISPGDNSRSNERINQPSGFPGGYTRMLAYNGSPLQRIYTSEHLNPTAGLYPSSVRTGLINNRVVSSSYVSNEHATALWNNNHQQNANRVASSSYVSNEHATALLNNNHQQNNHQQNDNRVASSSYISNEHATALWNNNHPQNDNRVASSSYVSNEHATALLNNNHQNHNRVASSSYVSNEHATALWNNNHRQNDNQVASSSYVSNEHATSLLNNNHQENVMGSGSISRNANITEFATDMLMLSDQTPCSFSNLLGMEDYVQQQTKQYLFPTRSQPLYDLNSPPSLQSMATSSTNITAMTSNHNETSENQLSSTPNFSVCNSLYQEKANVGSTLGTTITDVASRTTKSVHFEMVTQDHAKPQVNELHSIINDSPCNPLFQERADAATSSTNITAATSNRTKTSENQLSSTPNLATCNNLYQEKANVDSSLVTTIGDAASRTTKSVHFGTVTQNYANPQVNELHSIRNDSPCNTLIQERANVDNTFVTTNGIEDYPNRDGLLQNGTDSTVVNSMPLKEKIVRERGSQKGIDLNKTPHTKPLTKKRKHRPKVYRDVKAKRTVKPPTSRDTTPKEKPSGKRKYVRKAKLKEAETQPDLKEAETQPDLKEAATQTDLTRAGTNASPETAAKNSKRVLNFSSEMTQGGTPDGVVSHQKCSSKSDSHFSELISGDNFGTGVAQLNSVPIRNQKPRTDGGSVSVMNQIVSNRTSLQEQRAAVSLGAPNQDQQMKYWKGFSSSAHLESGRSQKSSVSGPSVIQHFDRYGVCLIDLNSECNSEVLPTTRKLMSPSLPQPAPRILSNPSESRGPKRDYQHHLYQGSVNPTASSSLRPDVSQVDKVCRNIWYPGMGFLETRKKVKTQSSLDREKYTMPSLVIDIEDDLNQPKTKAVSNVTENGFASSSNTARKVPATESRLVVYSANKSQKQSVTPSEPALSISGKELGKPKHLRNYQQYAGKPTGTPLAQHSDLDFIEEIIHKMSCLDLNGKKINQKEEHQQNALVLYKVDGALVAYEEMKKKKPRPKVDLDPETSRIWNLLMGKKADEEDEKMGKDKEKWWEEERRVFSSRADSFIARMHLVQGDRRFSPWKGSVVDSVIGVFLTQNVSDHLSSSAFMSLAARFPLKSKCNATTDKNLATPIAEGPELCVPDLKDGIEWNAKVLHHPQDTQSSVTAQSQRSKEFQWVNENLGTDKINLVETCSGSLQEEVLSSQDSINSSVFQTNGGIRSHSGSNSDAEYPTTTDNYLLGSVRSSPMGTTTFFEESNSQLNGIPISHGTHSQRYIQEVVSSIQQNSSTDRMDNLHKFSKVTPPPNVNNAQMEATTNFSISNQLDMNLHPQPLEIDNYGVRREEGMYSWLSIASGVDRNNDEIHLHQRLRKETDAIHTSTSPHNTIPRNQAGQTMGSYTLSSQPPVCQETFPQNKYCPQYDPRCSIEETFPFQGISFTELLNSPETFSTMPDHSKQYIPDVQQLKKKAFDAEKKHKVVESNSIDQEHSIIVDSNERHSSVLKTRKVKADDDRKNAVDWDSLRKEVLSDGRDKVRSKDAMDSIDYETMRHVDVRRISDAIKERGMNNMLAERIQDFLNRVVRDHGSIDLEWLRDVPADKSKDYLLSIRGLGLKSVECVRLLTLRHLAFPVDTNVGRIAVRLGWVPLQPLPESLQLHLLEMYPMLESIQKYLWPRLCKLEQPKLYELHYQLITFGKVFCTKSKPNCNACPMRGECRHFASAFASARLALPGPEEKGITSVTVTPREIPRPTTFTYPIGLPPPEQNSLRDGSVVPIELSPPEQNSLREGSVVPIGLPPPEQNSLRDGSVVDKCMPIIEMPASPERECIEVAESDMEDAFFEDPDEIPTINLDMKEFTSNLQNFLQENMELREGDMSKALVALNQQASLPTPKLKNISRLRTEHRVYELPDSHPLLEGMDTREPDDPSPYLLAIWTPGETANSIQPSEKSCGSQDPSKLCNEENCFSCNSVREANSQTVRGTILIPCRTAMRGSFPLNGTYFQVNEVFADHASSLSPIDVPREWIWNLPRRMVYFGTSATSIFRGLSTEDIQLCFWRGFVCVRGFEQKSRTPRPLIARLHFPASRLVKNKKDTEK